MIRDALGEVGPWLYYFGNFALHYWPTIRATAIRPRGWHQQQVRLYYDAARIVAVYTTLHRAAEVYACEVSQASVMPLGVVVAIMLEVVAAVFISSAPLQRSNVWERRYLTRW